MNTSLQPQSIVLKDFCYVLFVALTFLLLFCCVFVKLLSTKFDYIPLKYFGVGKMFFFKAVFVPRLHLFKKKNTVEIVILLIL